MTVHHYLTFSEIEMLQAHEIFHNKQLHIMMIKFGEKETSISKITVVSIVVQYCAKVLGHPVFCFSITRHI